MKKVKFLAIALIVVMYTASALAIDAGMVIFYIVDEKGNKLEGAQIVITDDTKGNFKKELVTNEKGQARITLAFSHYRAECSKEGYISFIHPFKPVLGGKDKARITLKSIESEMKNVKENLSSKDKAVFQYNEAVEVLKTKDYDKAIEMLEETVTLDPELSVAQFNLGRVYLIKNQLEKAEACLLKALEGNPDMNPAYAMLADIYKRNGNEEGHQKYIKLAEEKGAISAVDYYNQAVGKINSGSFDEAKAILLKCIETDEKYADAYYQLGIIFISLGDNDKCIEYLKKYIELDPQGVNAGPSGEIIKSLGGTL